VSLTALVRDGAVRFRYAILAIVAAVIWLSTLSIRGWGHGDWAYFVAGAKALTGGPGLHVYAIMPQLQLGPISLLCTVPLRHLGPQHGWVVTSALGMALGLLSIRLIESTAIALAGSDLDRRRKLTTLIAGVFFLKAWSLPAVGAGHIDDVLALTGVIAGLLAVVRDRWLAASLAIGLGAACKPWALLVLPLAAAVPAARVRGIGVALVAAVAPWVPFVAADRRTLNVGHVYLPVVASSTLHALGLPVGSQPHWVRLAQFAVGATASGIAIARGRFFLVPLLAFAVRINLDPAVFDYYTAGAVVGAVVWDSVRPARLPGYRSCLVCFGLIYVPQNFNLVLHTSSGQIVVLLARLSVLLVPLFVVIRWPEPPGYPSLADQDRATGVDRQPETLGPDQLSSCGIGSERPSVVPHGVHRTPARG
jgi:hypothetical protein